MSQALPKTDRTKLAKLLALLGSDKAGERDAAGLAAHRLVQRHGLSWPQILRPPPVEKQLPELGILAADGGRVASASARTEAMGSRFPS